MAAPFVINNLVGGRTLMAFNLRQESTDSACTRAPPPYPILKHPDTENAHAFNSVTINRDSIRNQADLAPRSPIAGG